MAEVALRGLLSFDTDRVKDYVFATSRLVEVRGASALLEELNRNMTDQIVAQVLGTTDTSHVRIYTGGGSAMYQIPQDKADEVIQAVERLYRETTVTASITGAWASLDGRSFEAARNKVASKLREKKDARGRSPLVPLMPYLQFCDSCGLYPAAEPVQQPEGTTRHLCRSCAVKQERGRKGRVSLFWDEFKQTVRDAGQHETWKSVEPPDNFTQIGDKSHPPGYIGLIYSDGNQMGKFLETLQTPENYRRHALAIDKAIRRATYQTLCERVAPESPAAFEVLLLGGDDLLLVTTADRALDVAINIARTFERLTQPRLTLSSGVVIAHDSFPIAQMRDLAEALLKQAKRRSFEENNASTVDFMVVTASSASDLDRVRDETLTNRVFVGQPAAPAEAAISHRLTERPYTIDELENLIRHARQLAEVGFPRSRLQAMYEALFVSERAAMTAATLGVARTSQKKHHQAIVDFFTDFGVPIQAPQFPPWRRGKDQSATALGDLVEIYPFVGKR